MNRSQPRDPLADGMLWVSRITTVGLQFALPPLGGYWIDRNWSYAPLGVVVGGALGLLVGLIQVFAISREGDRKPERDRAAEDSPRTE